MAVQSDSLAGKYMSTVKIGPKGQIVIPKEVRQLYNIRPGDSFLLLADQDRGVALIPHSRRQEMTALFSQAFSLAFPSEDPS
ncbi:MAG: AbrB/MazE/SpoVT family DNA-binding domain-containing protein [Oscillospiraceae bacterium]|jgi:AbrB family looped-hinge helix DNA binding protein|nr:AbrB/MazE/SpoVT family DNA-binding domain-containing protein [Oscillospiraceae bacterium]